eukprot:gene2411-4680_t
MSTELQRQVNRLRTEVIQSAPIHQGRASLFLSPSEAAGVDIETIYDAATNGLRTLQQYDERFSKFFDNLLHPSSQSLQRELKTVEENKTLEKDIKKLLDLLALFADEISTHKVLEYLIRRYRVHELNSDFLIRCMLPYHNTKIFARIIQLSTISNTIWLFLDGVKTTGSPLPRQALVYRCGKDIALISALCQMTKGAIILAGNAVNTFAVKGCNRILSFFTATIIETAESHPFSESHLQALYPWLLEGLQCIGMIDSAPEQYRRSACMILAQIVRSSKLGTPLVHSLISSIMKAFVKANAVGRSSDVGVELVISLAMLVQFQQSSLVGGKVSLAAIILPKHHSNKTLAHSSSSECVLIPLFTAIHTVQSRVPTGIYSFYRDPSRFSFFPALIVSAILQPPISDQLYCLNPTQFNSTAAPNAIPSNLSPPLAGTEHPLHGATQQNVASSSPDIRQKNIKPSTIWDKMRYRRRNCKDKATVDHSTFQHLKL